MCEVTKVPQMVSIWRASVAICMYAWRIERQLRGVGEDTVTAGGEKT